MVVNYCSILTSEKVGLKFWDKSPQFPGLVFPWEFVKLKSLVFITLIYTLRLLSKLHFNLPCLCKLINLAFNYCVIIVLLCENKSVVIWQKMCQLHSGSCQTFYWLLLNSVQKKRLQVLNEVDRGYRVQRDICEEKTHLHKKLPWQFAVVSFYNIGTSKFNHPWGGGGTSGTQFKKSGAIINFYSIGPCW